MNAPAAACPRHATWWERLKTIGCEARDSFSIVVNFDQS